MRIQLKVLRAIGAALMATLLQGAHAQETHQNQPVAETKQQTTEVKTFPTNQRRQIWFRHLKELPSDIKTAGLHINVKGAEKTTQRLTELFQEAGYNMVPADQAKYRYEMLGSFSSEGKLKTQILLADVLKGVEVQGISNTPTAKSAADVAFASVLADQALKAGLTSPLWATGDILHALLHATGLRDKFNTALTGDRRGICLLGCGYWEWSDQSVGLSWQDPRVKGETTHSVVNVGVFAEGVFAEELTSLAFNEFLRHHGIIDIPAPDGEAQMPMNQILKVIMGRVKRTRELIE